jgi:3',5'-cyclic AMP phosphodiesterase CpdA
MTAASSERTVRIVQVSDTHLSEMRAYFHDNWEVFRAEMERTPPDLIVNSGDLSFDGPKDEADLAFARAEHDRLPAPWIAIPGNHDTGESPLAVRLDQPVNAERIARWRRHIGPNWWMKDIGQWRLAGIDTALLGSGLPEEARQRAFLEAALAGRGDRPVLLFQHMPPFLDTADNPAPTALAVPHAVRSGLLETCRAGGVGTIACGHVHIYQRRSWQGIDIVWAPATSFFNIADQQKAGRGTPRAGYLEWTLEGRTARHKLIEPPLMLTHDIGAWNAAHGSTTRMPPRPLRRS